MTAPGPVAVLAASPEAPHRPWPVAGEALLDLAMARLQRWSRGTACAVDAAAMVRRQGSGRVGEVAWAVDWLGRRLGLRCLDAALVARRMCARRGIATEFLLGVRPSLPGTVDAHAWVRLPAEDAVDLGARLGYQVIHAWRGVAT